MSSQVLPDPTADQIEVLSQEGNVLLEDAGDWKGAADVWQKAIDLLPAPQTSWPEALWLFASRGAAFQEDKQIDEARFAFETAFRCPDGHINPFVLLQLGKIYADDGREAEATRLLLRAYMLEGSPLFAEDPQALAYLRARADGVS